MNSIILGNFQIFSHLRYNSEMITRNDMFPENLYHSYIVEGDPLSTPKVLLTHLETRKDIGKNNPDILFLQFDSLTITDAGQIKDWHSIKGISDKKRICIVSAKFINREAEQSLLKIIEEPHEGTHFFLIVPTASLLLDTILSRTHVVKMPESVDSEQSKFAQKFIASSVPSRLTLVSQMLDEYKDNETSGGVRFYATNLINHIEVDVFKHFHSGAKDEKTIFILGELQKARGYLSTPGASVKMILEHIALVL